MSMPGVIDHPVKERSMLRMENKMLKDSELEQVTGGKSYDEWYAYLDSFRNYDTSERRSLILAARKQIKNDPDLSESDRKSLENKMDVMWGRVK